jgi:cell division protein FtsB
LHEAEHTITGLKAAQKATQEFIVAQNAELKKENNQLREEMAVLRRQTSQAGNDGKEASPGASIAVRLEDVKKLQGGLQELKRQNNEIRRQAEELRDYMLNKQEEFSRKRRRTDSDTDKSEEVSVIIQLLTGLKPYLECEKNLYVGFRVPVKNLAEDLCRARELRLSLPDSEIEANMTDFTNSRQSYMWHCLREVCEYGSRAVALASCSFCPRHKSGCEFMISKVGGLYPGQLRFSYSLGPKPPLSEVSSTILQACALSERASIQVSRLLWQWT